MQAITNLNDSFAENISMHMHLSPGTKCTKCSISRSCWCLGMNAMHTRFSHTDIAFRSSLRMLAEQKQDKNTNRTL